MAITDCLSILKAHSQNDIARALDATAIRTSTIETTGTVTVTSLLATAIGTAISIPVYENSMVLVFGGVTLSHSTANQFAYLNLFVNGISSSLKASAQLPAEYSGAHGKEFRLERFWVFTPAGGVQTYQLGLSKVLTGTLTSKYQKLTAFSFKVS
jgi:hypothetical protein